jgi:hypothetical protein
VSSRVGILHRGEQYLPNERNVRGEHEPEHRRTLTDRTVTQTVGHFSELWHAHIGHDAYTPTQLLVALDGGIAGEKMLHPVHEFFAIVGRLLPPCGLDEHGRNEMLHAMSEE